MFFAVFEFGKELGTRQAITHLILQCLKKRPKQVTKESNVFLSAQFEILLPQTIHLHDEHVQLLVESGKLGLNFLLSVPIVAESMDTQ